MNQFQPSLSLVNQHYWKILHMINLIHNNEMKLSLKRSRCQEELIWFMLYLKSHLIGFIFCIHCIFGARVFLNSYLGMKWRKSHLSQRSLWFFVSSVGTRKFFFRQDYVSLSNLFLISGSKISLLNLEPKVYLSPTIFSFVKNNFILKLTLCFHL